MMDVTASERDQVLAALRAALPALRQRFPIRSLGIFGSFARGDIGAGSDVDVLVEFDVPVELSPSSRSRMPSARRRAARSTSSGRLRSQVGRIARGQGYRADGEAARRRGAWKRRRLTVMSRPAAD
jgi:hypothetical protein